MSASADDPSKAPAGAAPSMADAAAASYESVLSSRPLVVRKRVRWADCDPAGVVYTGKFCEYLLVASGYFFDVIGQGRYFQWIKELEVDTPCKGLELEFHGALWPEDIFDMAIGVSAIRAHSYDLRVEATQAGGRRVFAGRFSPICISRSVRQRVPIPPAMVEALQQHRVTRS